MTGEAVTHTEARAQSAPPIYFEELRGEAEGQTLPTAAAFILMTEAGANHMTKKTTAGWLVKKLKYTVKEAAAVLGVSEWTVRRYYDRGLLEGYETDGGQQGYSRGPVVQQRILWLWGRSVRALVNSKPKRGRKVDTTHDTEKRKKWREAQKKSRELKAAAQKAKDSKKRPTKRAATTGQAGSKSTATRPKRK